MAARRIDGWWYADFRVNRVRYRKRSPVNTRAGAQKHEQELRKEIALHDSLDHLDPKKQPEKKAVPTFAEFAERWLREYAADNKPSSRNEKRYAVHGHLVPAFGQSKLAEINAAEIVRYKNSKQDAGLCAKTINNHLTILRKCLDTAVEWGELSVLPRIKFLSTSDPGFRFLLPTQVDALIAAAPPGLWRSMITTALRTGLRFSELIELRWSDFDWGVGEHGIVTVRRANVRGHIGSPKNNRVRHVPLTSDVASAVAALVSGSTPRSHELVFMFEDRYVRYDTAWKHLTTICHVANVPRVSWHDLRHTFASQLVSAGAPLKAVQELMGHQAIEMTMRYAHLAPDVRHAAVALLDPKQPREWAAVGQRKEQTAPTLALDDGSQGSILSSTQQKTPAFASVL